jgi:hypothetical protein
MIHVFAALEDGIATSTKCRMEDSGAAAWNEPVTKK